MLTTNFRPGFSKNANKLLKLSDGLIEKVEQEVKAMLHASRDCLRNQGVDTTNIRFDAGDGYFGEAFGIMRALQFMGYGYFGSSNLNAVKENKYPNADPRQNLRWWFTELEDQVMEEEKFGRENFCEYCFERYRKG